MQVEFDRGEGPCLLFYEWSQELDATPTFILDEADLLRAIAYWFELKNSDEVIRALELLELEKRGAIPSKEYIIDTDGTVKRSGQFKGQGGLPMSILRVVDAVCQCGHLERYHDNEASRCDVAGCNCEIFTEQAP